MQTVSASVIFDDAYRSIGWDVDQLEPRQKQMARVAFSQAFQEIWESWWWQELMLSVPVAGASVYAAATTYAAAATVYYPATKKFYQAMRATTGNAPATIDSNGSYTTNVAYWADAKEIYTGTDYVVGQNDTGLPLGTVARWPDDGEYYQLYAYNPGVVVSGAAISAVNGFYTEFGSYAGHPAYASPDLAYVLTWHDGDTESPPRPVGWSIAVNGTGEFLYMANTTDVATPDLATDWSSVDNATLLPNTANNPAPTVIASTIYGAPSATANWTKLNPFTPELTVAGEVRAVGTADLRNSPNAGEVEFEKTLTGIRVPGWTEGVPWVWYRRPAPVIAGDDYSTAVVYTATPAASLCFS